MGDCCRVTTFIILEEILRYISHLILSRERLRDELILLYHKLQVHSSGSEATFRRLVFLKCLSADGSLSLVWTNLRVLLFINAFTYKLLNMIAIESPFVKDFRDFSETLKGYTNPKHFMI